MHEGSTWGTCSSYRSASLFYTLSSFLFNPVAGPYDPDEDCADTGSCDVTRWSVWQEQTRQSP